MATKAVIFDLLTALLDSWSFWNAAAGSEDAGRRWRTRYLELTYACGAYRPYEDLVAESAIDTGLPADAVSKLLASWDSLQPWPEAVEVLKTLRNRGYGLGVVTNCSADLGRRAIARCGGVRFDAVVTAEESGFYKPNPKPYNDILAALGVDPADALFVAGSSADVPGAAAVGMQVVWHNRANLPAFPGSAPLREGRTLQESLHGFLGYKGLTRSEISTPSLYLNRKKFAENCERMRQRAAGLQAQFRVHIKTHKTVEGTEIGLSHGEDRIVVSTLKEIEHVAPLIRKGTVRSVLYGLPPAKTYIPRLASLKRRLGFELILMIDHPSQISMLEASNLEDTWSIFIKVDCGTHRAGLEPQSPLLTSLIQTALQSSDKIHIYGFYCHSGHSYASNSLAEAEGHLLNEITAASDAARQCLQLRPDHPQLTISVGATPTAHAASSSVAEKIQNLIPGKLELHAGNFGLLDLQQVSTGLVALDHVSSWVEAEVCSVYPERQEILVNVGTLGLAREPGREPGVWGRAMILPAEMEDLEKAYAWNVVRLSQEHGILAPRTTDPKEKEELVNKVPVGARVRIIPQHACITGAMYDSYIVVDEDEGECVDEWVRCRGW
ncbi:hypothetical protein VTN00DRAFT_2948 [Thermoascus crustaceus]|uniref:uncharacterized protein n=1 Tax=Thermoascus crustaceus TaxID=5088 RepID=UPI0037431DD5